ncbi:MAG: hypothetical protein K2X77_11340 [Candidatus Obscuribacterales bacterium]|jgi:hypothetical protein|nr:hypothetical protein [Candidatus Obscuribacterales bacterium]
MSDQQSTIDEQQGAAAEPVKKLKKTTSLTSKILRGVSSRSPQRTMRWIASLTGEADEVEGIVESLVEEVFDPDQKAPNTMSAWIEYMFAAFQEYEVEFNRAVGSKSEFKISTEPPNLGGAPTKTSPDPTSFSGKVYTKEWALLLRGNYASLEGYIMPCSQLIMFSGDPSRFTKFFRIDVNLSNGVRWRLGGEEIHYSQLRSLSMQLFSSLIKVAKGQKDDKATFVFLTLDQLKAQASQRPPQQAPQIPPNVFANPMAVPGSQFVAREPVNTGRPGYPTGNPGAPMQQRPPVQAQQGPRPSGPPTGQQAYQGGPQTGTQQAPQYAQGPQTGTQSAPPYAQGGPQTGTQQAPQYAQGPQTGTQQAPQYAQGPQTGTQPAPQYAQGPQTGTRQAPPYVQSPPAVAAAQNAQGPQTATRQAPQQAPQQSDPNFEQSCLYLFRAIDREMEKLSIQGTQAFQHNDIGAADLAIKSSAKLARLKEQLLECVTDLRESKKE